MRNTTVSLPIHPKTGLRALGWRKLRKHDRGLPLVWPAIGGSGEGDGNTGDGGGDDQGGETGGTGTGDQGDASKTSETGDASKPEGKQYDESYVKDLRTENAKHRTENKQFKGVIDALAKVLNPDGKGGEVTPEQLAQQLSEKDGRIRELETLDAIRKAAGNSVNVDELLDSNSFRAKLKDLDHTAKGFGDQVAAEVAAAVKAKPSLKLGPSAPKSGADFSGAQTGNKGKRPKGLSDAVNRHYAS